MKVLLFICPLVTLAAAGLALHSAQLEDSDSDSSADDSLLQDSYSYSFVKRNAELNCAGGSQAKSSRKFTCQDLEILKTVHETRRCINNTQLNLLIMLCSPHKNKMTTAAAATTTAAPATEPQRNCRGKQSSQRCKQRGTKKPQSKNTSNRRRQHYAVSK